MTRHSRMVLPAVALSVILAACAGGTGDESGSAQAVAVEVRPPSANLSAGGSVAFAAAVTGTADTAVVWTIVEQGGGTVDTTGLYTAPAAPGTFHVRATSHANAQAFGESTVNVQAPVAVTISPRTPSVVAGGTLTFTATVANTTNTAVTWSVSGTSCGTITQAGVYTAPSSAKTCSVVATSQADPTRSDTATVTVTAPPPPITVAVTPATGTTDACKTLTFTATVGGTANQAVTWSVQEGAAGGTITAAGVYTAPANAGTYHVVATSAADSSKTAVATVTVADHVLAVSVSPATVQLAPGGTAQFTATVTTTCGSFVATQTVTAPL